MCYVVSYVVCVCGGKEEDEEEGGCYYAPQGHYRPHPWGEEVTGPGRHSPMTSNALLTPGLQGRTPPFLPPSPLPFPPDIKPR